MPIIQHSTVAIYGQVSPDATIGPNVMTHSRTKIKGRPTISNTVLYSAAVVRGSATLRGGRRPSGYSFIQPIQVMDQAIVGGNALVEGWVHIGEDAQVYGDAVITGPRVKPRDKSNIPFIGPNAMMFRPDHYIRIGPVGASRRWCNAYRLKGGGCGVTVGHISGTLEELEARIQSGGHHIWESSDDDHRQFAAYSHFIETVRMRITW